MGACRIRLKANNSQAVSRVIPPGHETLGLLDEYHPHAYDLRMVTSDSASTLEAEGRRELGQGTGASNERAVALFERALDVDPKFAPAYIGLTRAWVQRTRQLRLGRRWLDPAITAGEKAVELDPSLGDAYVALGVAYRSTGKLRKELDLWQRRAHLEPDDPDATERVGWILWFTGRANEALPWLQKTVAQRPAGEWGHFYLGNAHLALRNYSEAERMYRRMLELHPDHSSAHAGAIWSLLAASKDEEARSLLRIFQASPLDGDRYFLKVADLEHFLGENETALLHGREALAEEPEERYWPRGFTASTIVGAILWSTERAAAEDALRLSEQIDRDRLDGGDEGYMPHINSAAVNAIRGDIRAACQSFSAAVLAGWRYQSLAVRDPLFRALRADDEFQLIVAD